MMLRIFKLTMTKRKEEEAITLANLNGMVTSINAMVVILLNKLEHKLLIHSKIKSSKFQLSTYSLIFGNKTMDLASSQIFKEIPKTPTVKNHLVSLQISPVQPNSEVYNQRAV